MSIQWFPGHMNVTRKAIAERVSEIDVVIELLDARLPGSSANPLLAELTRGKPALKILNKQDLADPERTRLWLAHYQAQAGTHAFGLDASEPAPARRLIDASRALAPLRGGMVKPMRVLICGIPNVGKSTLMNSMVGQRSAKTGDEPGITKVEQKILLASDFYLFDTPGMLWPRISVIEAGYHLAASGAIGRNAFDEEDVALELLARVRVPYRDRLEARYKLSGLKGLEALTDSELLELIGRKRGGLMPGGIVNRQKAAEIVLHDFRSGAWGRITLETPEEYALWHAAGEQREAERAARKAARQAARGKGTGRRDDDAGDAPGSDLDDDEDDLDD
ncbi:MAG: hypothetical protein RLZZ524_158 [Pseudomonadota bacterium]